MEKAHVLQPTIFQSNHYISSYQYLFTNSQTLTCQRINCYDFSQSLLVLSIINLCRNDSGVARLKALWCLIQVLVGRNELSLVVGASIADYDL